jgi:hypothetical protein
MYHVGTSSESRWCLSTNGRQCACDVDACIDSGAVVIDAEIDDQHPLLTVFWDLDERVPFTAASVSPFKQTPVVRTRTEAVQ